MNYHLDHSPFTIDDQHRQFIFISPDSSTVFLTFDKLAELHSIVRRYEEEMVARKLLEWTTLKAYRNSVNIPVDIELIQSLLTKANITFQIVDSVHPEDVQVQQKDVHIAVTIINRLGYETSRDSEEEEVLG